MIKIGILGEMRAGKDTVTELLLEELNGHTVTLAFADGIHKVINEHMPLMYLDGKPREALQELGQTFRKYKSDVWIDKLFHSLSYQYAERIQANVIITDVRQLNEVEALKEKGFLLIKVTADVSTRIKRAEGAGDVFTPEMLDHESELQVRQAIPHCYVHNTGTIEELRASVKTIVEAYGLLEVTHND